MTSSRFAPFVTNLMGVLGLGMCVVSYFAMAGSGQELDSTEEVAIFQAFCAEPVGPGAVTCNSAACREADQSCKPVCDEAICNVPQGCRCMLAAVGCSCIAPTAGIDPPG